MLSRSSWLWLMSLLTSASLTVAIQTFSNNLAVSDLFIQDAFQANSRSTLNGTLYCKCKHFPRSGSADLGLPVTIRDYDTPSVRPIKCHIEWTVGTEPPDKTFGMPSQCENDSFRVWFPKDSYQGVTQLRLDMAHQYADPSIGKCPDLCQLTKFASLNLTFPGTTNYDCDVANGCCESRIGTSLDAKVVLAVSK